MMGQMVNFGDFGDGDGGFGDATKLPPRSCPATPSRSSPSRSIARCAT
jgi:hypothetical protein